MGGHMKTRKDEDTPPIRDMSESKSGIHMATMTTKLARQARTTTALIEYPK